MRGYCSVSLVLLSSVVVACASSSGAGKDAGQPDSSPADAVSPEAGTCMEGGTGAWEAQPVRVDKSSTSGDMPRVAFDPAGNAIAVWEQTDASGVPSVWSSRRTPDGTWSTPVQLNASPISTGGNTPPSPQLAVSADGSAIVVWQQLVPGMVNLWANHFAPGTGWGGEQKIQANGKGTPHSPYGDPRVAMDAAGNAVAVFSQDVGVPAATHPDGSTQVYANRYVAGMGWSGAVLLSADWVPNPDMNHSTAAAGLPRVAMDPAGDATAVWTAVIGQGTNVQAARYDTKSGQWTLPDTATTVSSLGTCPCGANPNDLDVAMDASGNAMAVWAEQSGTAVNAQIRAARYMTGSGWGPSTGLDAVQGGTDQSPRIAVDSSGNAAAVWYSSKTPNVIYAAVFQGGAWKPAVALDDGTYTNTGGRPTVTFDALGNGIAVWDDQTSVFASELPPASATWGTQQKIAAPPGAQGYTDVDIAPAPPGCLRALTLFWGSSGVWALAQH
jgi:hypothetical protein